jgi:hypothetical protein
MFKNEMIIVTQKRGMIPEILNSGKIISKIRIINIFKIKEKRPRVKTLKGRVIRFKIGFIKKLIKPKTIPIKIKICQS